MPAGAGYPNADDAYFLGAASRPARARRHRFGAVVEHPTPNVPRLADGKPNLQAPAPRTADGRPDLSGIWYLHFDGCGPFGCADYQAGPEFFNFGAKLPGGLPYLPWAAALVKERQAAFAKDDPIGLAVPAASSASTRFRRRGR